MKLDKNLEKKLKEQAINVIKGNVIDVMKDDVEYVAKKIIVNNIRREVYNKDFGGSRNLRTGDFNKPENIKSYVTVQDNDKSCKIAITLRNETSPNSIFNTPVYSNYPGIFGYWIEVGCVPVLWDNGNGQYVNKTFKFTDKHGVKHTVMKFFPPRPWMEESKKEAHSGALAEELNKGMKYRGLPFN